MLGHISSPTVTKVSAAYKLRINVIIFVVLMCLICSFTINVLRDYGGVSTMSAVDFRPHERTERTSTEKKTAVQVKKVWLCEVGGKKGYHLGILTLYSWFQSYCQVVLLFCDQRTTAEPPRLCLLGELHSRSTSFFGFPCY